jgi:hypothetical protein
MPYFSPNVSTPHSIGDAPLNRGRPAGSGLDLHKGDSLDETVYSESVKTHVIDWIHERTNIARIVIESLQERCEAFKKVTEQGRARPLNRFLARCFQKTPHLILTLKDFPDPITDDVFDLPLASVKLVLSVHQIAL